MTKKTGKITKQKNKANAQWKDIPKGESSPVQEATGSMKLLAIFLTVITVLLVIAAIGIPIVVCSSIGRGYERIDGELLPFTTFRFEFEAKRFFTPFFCLSPITVLFVVATVRYWKMYRSQLAQKKQFKAQKVQLGRKKRKKK